MKSPAMKNRLRKPALAIVAALVLSAGSAGAELPDPKGGVDQHVLEQFQQRVRALNASGHALASYHFAKVQAWVDAAVDAYHRGDRGPVLVATLQQAAGLLSRLEAGDRAIGLDTPLIPNARRLREDLWQQVERIKQQPGLRCAERALAQFEVALVMAGHFDAASGWRDARPYVQAAERLAGQAQTSAEGCRAEPVASLLPPAVMLAAPAAILTEPQPQPQPQHEERLSARRLDPQIYFDTGSVSFGAIERDLLERVAQRLRALPQATLVITGHADERGAAAANQGLSQRRAQAVHDHLRVKGIDAARMQVLSCGAADPQAAGDADALALNRRVRMRLAGDPEQPDAKALRCAAQSTIADR